MGPQWTGTLSQDGQLVSGNQISLKILCPECVWGPLSMLSGGRGMLEFSDMKVSLERGSQRTSQSVFMPRSPSSGPKIQKSKILFHYGCNTPWWNRRCRLQVSQLLVCELFVSAQADALLFLRCFCFYLILDGLLSGLCYRKGFIHVAQVSYAFSLSLLYILGHTP